MDKDRKLGFHVDDSEITLNLCLVSLTVDVKPHVAVTSDQGTEFAGGELFFRGVRCGLHQQTHFAPSESFDYEHSPGVAVLHIGKHRHGAFPLTGGHRVNMILWCRSSTYRAANSMASCFPGCLAEQAQREIAAVRGGGAAAPGGGSAVQTNGSSL